MITVLKRVTGTPLDLVQYFQKFDVELMDISENKLYLKGSAANTQKLIDDFTEALDMTGEEFMIKHVELEPDEKYKELAEEDVQELLK